MKNLQKNLLWVLCVALALFGGLYLGKHLFEPTYSVGMVQQHAQTLAGKTIKIQGRVSHKKVGLFELAKFYWLCDDETGACIPVKTTRVILPIANTRLCIRAQLKEPWALGWMSQLMLVEESGTPG